jgi:hypothetical protein
MSWEKRKIPLYQKWKQYWMDTHPSTIAEPSWDYLFTGGKEIRARLFCELWNYLSPDSHIQEELAFTIECIHVASLILDDTPWMDNAKERRGKPTLHIQFSEKKSLLLCYDVLKMARTMWLEHCPRHVSRHDWHQLMREKLQQLIMGQWMDMEQKGDLFELAAFKTGVLFELIGETVAICTGLDTEYWKRWGNHLGILFQWMDDWCDQEEDQLQGNRNSFNESDSFTRNEYIRIWEKVEKGNGKGWFTRPFGAFMKSYFTENIPFVFSRSKLSLLELPVLFNPIPKIPKITGNFSSELDFILQMESLDFIHRDRPGLITKKEVYTLFPSQWIDVEMDKKEVIKRVHGKQMLLHLFRLSEWVKEEFIEDWSLKTNLWEVEESAWASVPEFQEVLHKPECKQIIQHPFIKELLQHPQIKELRKHPLLDEFQIIINSIENLE